MNLKFLQTRKRGRLMTEKQHFSHIFEIKICNVSSTQKQSSVAHSLVYVCETESMPSAVSYCSKIRQCCVYRRHSYYDKHLNVTFKACFLRAWARTIGIVHTVSCSGHGICTEGDECFVNVDWRDTMKHFVIVHSERLGKEIFCRHCQLFEASNQHERRDSLLKMKLNHSLWRACSAATVAIKNTV